LVCYVFIGWAYKKLVENRQEILPSFLLQKWMPLIISLASFIGILIVLAQPQLRQYALPTRFWLDSNHSLISLLILIGTFIFALQQNHKIFQLLFIHLAVAIVAGVFMLFKFPFIGFLTRLSYSVFDVVIVLSLFTMFFISIKNLFIKRI
jgi:hypothetical protein